MANGADSVQRVPTGNKKRQRFRCLECENRVVYSWLRIVMTGTGDLRTTFSAVLPKST